jgi:hypothetical protein
MASTIFGSLGNLEGLVKGFAGLMPQDKPETKIFNTHTEISDLKKQEAEILAEIGRAAFEQNPGEWPQAEKLSVIRDEIAEKETAFKKLEAEQAAAKEADAATRCPSCGHRNPDATKFCQECGTKLGKSSCISCGAEIAGGARFCGVCGAKQFEE